jgi:small subunit ribosomal protein S4e
MGKKGERGHLKRKLAPKMWPIHRKEAIWTVKPTPGPHSSSSLPLGLVIRDILKFAKTGKEAKTILCNKKVAVDGKVRRDERFPVGLMDVISIVDAKKSYRVLPSKKGLFLYPVTTKEVAFKLCRIEDKTVVKGGHVQLDLHDGTSYLLPDEDVYKTLDVLKLSVPDRELLGHTKLAVGAPAIVTGGKNVGKYGKVTTIDEKPNQKRRNLIVTIEDKNGNEFQTVLDYVFILGDAQPSISLPEAD